MAHVTILTDIEVDTDEIIKDIPTSEIIKELELREINVTSFKGFEGYTLFQAEKLNFMLKNIDKISLSDLEQIAK